MARETREALRIKELEAAHSPGPKEYILENDLELKDALAKLKVVHI